MTRRLLITGCSGAGKSTLLDALGAAGADIVPEPGRRIVAAGRPGEMPWESAEGFARAALSMAQADLAQAKGLRCFFDRGVIDAAAALAFATGTEVTEHLDRSPYDDPVLLAAPWPAVFSNDAVRRHSWDEAVAEYERIVATLHRLGHQVAQLPQTSTAARVAFALSV